MYYYHRTTRRTMWHLPTPAEAQQMDADAAAAAAAAASQASNSGTTSAQPESRSRSTSATTPNASLGSVSGDPIVQAVTAWAETAGWRGTLKATTSPLPEVLRSMLLTLHTLPHLPPGGAAQASAFDWTAPIAAAEFEPGQMNKVWRKAARMLHPDRVSLLTGDDAIATAQVAAQAYALLSGVYSAMSAE